MSAVKIEQLTNYNCEKFIFDSNFDSGNLLKVECIKKPNGAQNESIQVSTTALSNESQQQQPHQQTNNSSSPTTSSTNNIQNLKVIDVEFNVWTRPDCFNHTSSPTSDAFKKCKNHECNGSCGNTHHGNRTWFFFSIRGGEKNQLVKFNFMNLNKQAKLFSQGMHPVTRHGINGKWERIKDKPTFIITEDSFVLSFTHRTGENVEDNLTFYAFTFPYTYTEHLQMLDSYDRKYKKSLEEVESIIRELRHPCKDKIVIDIHQTVNTFSSSRDDEKSHQTFSITNLSEDAHDGSVLLQEKFENILLSTRSFSSSIDGENTSDSMQQLSSLVHNSMKIEKTTECSATIIKPPPVDELKNEIYYHRELLINSFEQRRVDFLTITSFEGIEDEHEERLKNLFPDFSAPRCHNFKNKKIIFLSSRVHPGETVASFVLNGFINLLLDRKSQIASILRKLYVFKIIPFLNPDGVANGLYRSDTLGHNLNRVYLKPRLDIHPSIYAVRKLIRYYHYGCEKPDIGDEQIYIGAGCMLDEEEPIELSSLIIDNESDVTMIDKDPKEGKKTNTTDIIAAKMEMQQSNVNNTSNNNNNNNNNNHTVVERKPHITKLKTGASSSVGRKLKDTVKNMVSSDRKSSRDDGGAKSICHHHYKHMISHYNCEKATEKMLQQMSSNNSQQQQQPLQQQPGQNVPNLNISMEYRIKTDENGEKSIIDESSNLFLYLDMHGHASKKGVFMYGNHLSNTMEAVEVMLLPKLMSLNCHHFHFDACNFSERNMYLKGRRDGLSKEGSGRVAIYKATGLIKSYTLESNYNMAKCVNVLPPKGKELSCKIHNMIPPKFSPSILEDVGKALGPSLLDLTNSNPLSRIPNSEFRSLHGLRNALKNEINRGLSRARVTKYAKMTKKRQNSIISSSSNSNNDTTSKENENKGSFSPPSLNVATNSSSTSSSSLSVGAQNKPLKIAASTSSLTPTTTAATIISKSSKVLSTFMKKDSMSTTKKKILRENVTAATALANTQHNLHHNHHQIPHKKIRVSGMAGNTNNPNVVAHSVEKDSFESDLVPCCSRSIPAFSIYTKAPSSPSSGSASSSSNSGQVKVTSFMPIKKVGVTKFTNKTLGVSVKKSRSENVVIAEASTVPTFQTISEKLIKKKKRLLVKSDTAGTLKRKKSRPQKPLV